MKCSYKLFEHLNDDDVGGCSKRVPASRQWNKHEMHSLIRMIEMSFDTIYWMYYWIFPHVNVSYWLVIAGHDFDISPINQLMLSIVDAVKMSSNSLCVRLLNFTFQRIERKIE